MGQTRSQILLFKLIWLLRFGNVWRRKIYQKITCLKNFTTEELENQATGHFSWSLRKDFVIFLCKGQPLTWLTFMTPSVLFLTLKSEFIRGDCDCLRFCEVSTIGRQWEGSCESCVEALLWQMVCKGKEFPEGWGCISAVTYFVWINYNWPNWNCILLILCR